MKVGILGAGGHARTLISLLEQNNISIHGVFDSNYDPSQPESIDGYELVNNFDHIPEGLALVIAKGTPKDKKTLIDRFSKQLFKENILHPNSIIETINLGKYNQISASVFIAKSAQLANHNIVYSNTSIEHEAKIGNNNVITVNVSICGRVKIGNSCFLGASSTILPTISICDHVVIGAGAVVTKDISEPGTYIGVPAKRVNL